VAKKSRQIPLIVGVKTEDIKKSEIDLSLDNNKLTIKFYNHEVHQYLRHRTGRYVNYDPLGKYKKAIEERISNHIELNPHIKDFIDQNKDLPVKVNILVQSLPSKSNSTKSIFYMLLGKIYKIKTPDIDNYQKTLFDVSNKLLWEDDAQIYEVTARKQYGQSNYTEFSITYEDIDKDLLKGTIKKDEYKDKLDLYEMARKIKKGEINNGTE